jgi:hypothetical protein
MSAADHYRRYIQTPKGQAARRRALENWNAKRRERRAREREGVLAANPAPLAQALSAWGEAQPA